MQTTLRSSRDTGASLACILLLATAGQARAAGPVTVSGDFRLRGQGDYSSSSARDRNSAQVRGRLGATYKATDRVTVGARLVTGDSDDPNSTDVQLSNFDDDLDVSLDLAYVQLNFDELQLFGGKLPQQFVRTDLVWDGDVNPQGLAGTYRQKREIGGGFRASALAFIIDEQVAGPESKMAGAQVGYDTAQHGAWKYAISAAYYDYTLDSIAGGDTGDFRSNLRNPDGSYVSDFNLADVVAEATWTGSNPRWPVRVVGDYVRNFGAVGDEDTAYGVDVSVGRISAHGDWRLTYGYSAAETDAVFAAFSHDNIGVATNYRLHALTVDYVPMPKTLITAIWYHYETLHSVAPTEWLDRIRVAFTVTF